MEQMLNDASNARYGPFHNLQHRKLSSMRLLPCRARSPRKLWFLDYQPSSGAKVDTIVNGIGMNDAMKRQLVE